MRDYTKYEVWQLAVELAVEIYKITDQFPEKEKFGLVSQMNRSVVSISSNIAEGASRTSEKEFFRFLKIAIGSAFELKSQLIIVHEVGLISERTNLEAVLLQIDSVCRQLKG